MTTISISIDFSEQLSFADPQPYIPNILAPAPISSQYMAQPQQAQQYTNAQTVSVN